MDHGAHYGSSREKSIPFPPPFARRHFYFACPGFESALEIAPGFGENAASYPEFEVPRAGEAVREMTVQEDLGDIKINNEVVGTIAAIAIGEVEGVIPLAGRSAISEMLGGRKKGVDKGVEVQIEESRVDINVEVDVEYGIDIYKAAHNLQKAVKVSVESMTGLIVNHVNVSVRSIVEPESKPQSSPKTEEADPSDVQSVEAS